MCAAEGHVLGSRARRQASTAAAPLHLYNLWLFHPLFSIDFGPICTPASQLDCPQITLNLVLNLIVLCKMFVRAANYMTWFGMVLWSAACCWLSLASCWLHTSITSSSQFLPEEQPATWSIGYVKIAPASSLPGAGKGLNVGRQQNRKAHHAPDLSVLCLA